MAIRGQRIGGRGVVVVEGGGGHPDSVMSSPKYSVVVEM